MLHYYTPQISQIHMCHIFLCDIMWSYSPYISLTALYTLRPHTTPKSSNMSAAWAGDGPQFPRPPSSWIDPITDQAFKGIWYIYIYIHNCRNKPDDIYIYNPVTTSNTHILAKESTFFRTTQIAFRTCCMMEPEPINLKDRWHSDGIDWWSSNR